MVAVARAVRPRRVLLLASRSRARPVGRRRSSRTFDKLRGEVAMIIVEHNLDLCSRWPIRLRARARQRRASGATSALREDLDLRRHSGCEDMEKTVHVGAGLIGRAWAMVFARAGGARSVRRDAALRAAGRFSRRASTSRRNTASSRIRTRHGRASSTWRRSTRRWPESPGYRKTCPRPWTSSARCSRRSTVKRRPTPCWRARRRRSPRRNSPRRSRAARDAWSLIRSIRPISCPSSSFAARRGRRPP